MSSKAVNEAKTGRSDRDVEPSNDVSPPSPIRGPTTVITAGGQGLGRELRELWNYRELLYFFTWRDIKVRYKQTVFGAGWAVIQPFLLMIVFSIFFGRLAGVESDDVPYPIFAYAALVPWTLFASSLTTSSQSLVAGQQLVSKIYFPRLLLPVASVGSYVLDFFIALTLLIGMMVWYDTYPTIAVLALPAFIVLALVTALGVGVWLSALNVRYRDVRYAITFLVQLWLFASPVAYSSSIVPEQWQNVYALNPMVGVIDGFRWALLDADPPGSMAAVSAAVAFVILAGALAYFRRVERTFADVI